MAQAPLNERGGRAAIVLARLPDPDVARLTGEAARRGLPRSQVVRELIRAGLDRLETDSGPPPGG